MACEHCDFKGYVLISMAKNNVINNVARPCPKCKDKAAYSKYVREKYGTKKPKLNIVKKDEADVLDFQKFKKEKEKEES